MRYLSLKNLSIRPEEPIRNGVRLILAWRRLEAAATHRHQSGHHGASPTASLGGITLGIAQEDAVRGFVLETECERMDASRVERLLDRMAPDARYHVRAWQEPFVGHDAIRNELLRQAPLFSDGCYETVNMASVGETVFSERVDTVTVNEKRATFHLVDVFEVDADGKIASWRTYSDPGENAVNTAPDSGAIGD